MNPKPFAFILLFLGLAFTAICIYFSIQPVYANEHRGGTTTTNGNMGRGAIALGLISASCFVGSAYLSKKTNI